MAKKQIIDEDIAQIKKAIEKDQVIIGTDKTIKELKKGNLAKVYISSNCPENIKSSLEHYTTLSGAELVKLKYLNDEFAVLCKKPFIISVIGLKKE